MSGGGNRDRQNECAALAATRNDRPIAHLHSARQASAHTNARPQRKKTVDAKGSPLAKLAATANAAHRGYCRNAIEAGRALIKAKKLVKQARRSWARWIADNCDFSERTAQAYMQVARNPQHAADSLRQALKKSSRFSHCHGEEEYYTPQPIIDAVHSVFGGHPDLDPASCAEANGNVQAMRFFAREDNGLEQPWRGRVWMNPPFTKSIISRFCEKLVAHVNDGSVTDAIVLVNSTTDTRWFATLSSAASAVCFPTGRIKFWKPGRATGSLPLGQALFYFGRAPENFHHAFR